MVEYPLNHPGFFQFAALKNNRKRTDVWSLKCDHSQPAGPFTCDMLSLIHVCTGGEAGPSEAEEAVSQPWLATGQSWDAACSELVSKLETRGFTQLAFDAAQHVTARRPVGKRSAVSGDSEFGSATHMCPSCGEASARLYPDQELGRVVAQCDRPGCSSCTAQMNTAAGTFPEDSSSGGGGDSSSSASISQSGGSNSSWTKHRKSSTTVEGSEEARSNSSSSSPGEQACITRWDVAHFWPQERPFAPNHSLSVMHTMRCCCSIFQKVVGNGE